MAEVKFKTSIFFVDSEGGKRFLFKVINYGQETDELKFIFNHPESTDAIILNKEDGKYPEEITIRDYGELSYHSDGSLLWKLPKTKDGIEKVIDNPHGTGTRRTPLTALDEWEPVILGNIIRYKNCLTGLTQDARILPENDVIFSGDPFEYYIFLGHMKYQKPPNNGSNELIYRVNDIGENIDLILWVRKSNYYGEPFDFGGQQAINDNNRVRIAQPKLQFNNNGAIEIDLKILWNASWHVDIVSDQKMFNLQALRKLPPKTLVGKAYLNDNPYLIQLIDLISFNKGVAICPLFKGKKLGIEFAGVLDKDENGALFAFGTSPEN